MAAIDHVLKQKNFDRLSRREREIVKMWQLTGRQQAAQLGLSLYTIQTYRKNIRKKLGVGAFFEIGFLIRDLEDHYRDRESPRIEISFLCPYCGKAVKYGIKESES